MTTTTTTTTTGTGIQAPILDAPSDTRADVIAIIRSNLRIRSGKSWSVTGGRGTAWGWLSIDSPRARRNFNNEGDASTVSGDTGYSSRSDRMELAQLLGFTGPVHCQGVSIPGDRSYWQEYVDRSAGIQPRIIGRPYWD